MGTFNRAIGNRMTTLFGALAAVSNALALSFPEYSKILIAVAGVCGALGLFFAKDASTGSAPGPQ